MINQYTKNFLNWFKKQPIHKKLFVLYSFIAPIYIPLRILDDLRIYAEYMDDIEILQRIALLPISVIWNYFLQLAFAALFIGIFLGAYDALKNAIQDKS